MVRETKRKQFHYRRAVFLRPTGEPLQSLLESALSKLTPIAERFQETPTGAPDQDWKMFINHHPVFLGMQFGNLVMYAPAQAKSAITMDLKADELNIEQIFPPTDGERNREFLDSILHFGIMKNHVILLQSMSLRARDFEKYLNDILRKANLLPEDNAVFLDSTPPPSVAEQAQKIPVKSVKIGTPLFLFSPTENNSDDLETKKINLSFPKLGEGMEILKALIPERIKEFVPSDFYSTKNLEVHVEISYKRQTNESSTDFLGKLARSLRNSGEDDLRIELKNGSIILGSELQIKNNRPITFNDGLINQQEAFESMYSWLLELLENGTIDA